MRVGSDNSWASIAAAAYHSLALKSDGTLWEWGYNLYGQLGDGTTTERHSPIQIIISTAATLISPNGTIATATPTYIWNAVPESTWYNLWVNDSTGNRIQQWHAATAVGCPTGTGTCSIALATILNPGGAQWWIQTWNSSGVGPWSASMPFTVP